MDLTKAIAELYRERQAIAEAIQVLQRLGGGGRRRGRPPKWLAALTQDKARSKPGRKGMSQAARKAQSERMKKYWSSRRKSQA
jgi:hypothetical protein